MIDTEIKQLIADHAVVVHGDFKTANVFFSEADSEASMIDFQWSGAGIPEMDVAYILLSSANLDVLKALEGEAELRDLLQRYYDQVLKLIEARGLSWYSFDQFIRNFKLAALDYFRVVVGAQT